MCNGSLTKEGRRGEDGGGEGFTQKQLLYYRNKHTPLITSGAMYLMALVIHVGGASFLAVPKSQSFRIRPLSNSRMLEGQRGNQI